MQNLAMLSLSLLFLVNSIISRSVHLGIAITGIFLYAYILGVAKR